MGALNRLRNLLFPAKCVVCGKIIRAERDELCPVCRRALPWAATVIRHGDYHEGVVSTVRYEDEIRDSFLRYKFGGCHWYGEVFGELLAETISIQLAGRYDLITWAPVSKARLRERGYDQSQLLAETAAGLLNKPVRRCLSKVKDTPANSGLPHETERRKNVADVYEALPGFEGKRVLLIDDVYTTGATMSECAKTLLLGGAESVICATFAAAK